MKIDQLNYFLEVAKQEHLGRASKVLNISPSAISHSITQLEDELGQDLFFREHKRIFLTPHGKLLQKRVADILFQLQNLKEDISHESAALTGHFRFGANAALIEPYLIPPWSKLTSENTNLTGEIYSMRSAEVLEKVSAGELDMGLCFSPESTSLINTRVIKRGNLLVAVRKKHPALKSGDFNKYPSLAPKALKGIENCVCHPVLKKLGLNSPVQSVFDNYATAISLLKSSNAWTLLPEFLITDDLQAAFAQQIPAPYTIAAIWPKDRPLLKPLQTLLELFLKKSTGSSESSPNGARRSSQLEVQTQ